MKNLLDKIKYTLNETSPVRDILPLAEELVYDEDLLTENVPLSTAKTYMRASQEHWTKKYQEWFGSYKKTLPDGKVVSKSRARIILPLGGSEPIMPLQADDKVVKYIDKLGYEITDYANNKCKGKKEGSKEMNIGGVLSSQINRMKSLEKIFIKQKSGGKLTDEENDRIKDKSLDNITSSLSEVTEAMNAFNSDQKKKASKASKIDTTQKYVVISRHPYDIAGMSGGRSWAGQSCMRVIPQAGSSEEVSSQGEKKPLKFKYTKTATTKRRIAVLDHEGKPVLDKEGNPKYKFFDTGEIIKNTEGKESHEFRPHGEGCNVWAVGKDIQYGTLVGYMIDGDEVYNVAYTPEYKVKLVDPKSRLLAKPYFDEKGVPYLIVTTSFYGERPNTVGDNPSKFKETFEKWIKKSQGERYGTFTFKKGGSSTEGLYLNGEKDVHKIKNPADNSTNVKEFKDGLTWEKVLSHFKWFAEGEFKDVVIGYSNNEFTLYDGTISVMDWKGGRILKGALGMNYSDESGTRLGNFHFHKGSIENVNWFYGTMIGGTIKDSTVHQVTFGRIKSMINCKSLNSSTLEGGFYDNCDFSGTTNLNPPVPEAKIKINNSTIQKLLINNLDANQKILNKCDIKNIVSEKAKATFNSCNLTGGAFNGSIINSCTFGQNFSMINGIYDAGIIKKDGKITSNSIKTGTFKDVHFKKMSTSGSAKFIRCTIDIGIINGGKFHDCIFKAGRFISGTFWGGEFQGGSFVGGKFVDSKFGENARWVGGTWHSEGEPPAKAKLPKEPLYKKKPRELSKTHKDLDLKTRLERKTLGV